MTTIFVSFENNVRFDLKPLIARKIEVLEVLIEIPLKNGVKTVQ